MTLNPGETKNDEGRTVYLDNELQDILSGLWEARKDRGKISPYVFLNESGKDRIKDLRGAWNSACQKAGIGDRLFHDFRRTAVRNMVRAGISERVAMMISGHKTRSVFDRYDIVSDTDLKEAAHRQKAYLESQTVTKTVTILDFEQKKEAINDDKPLNSHGVSDTARTRGIRFNNPVSESLDARKLSLS